MTVYDCFLFLNEVDILELRLMELYDVVDYFIIIESEYSFRGEKKGVTSVFNKNKKRFKKYLDKIVYFQLKEMPFYMLEFPTLEHVSEHSHWQREMLRIKLFENFEIKHNDVILVCDLDEIPRKEIVKQYSPSSGPHYMELTMYRFYFNLKCKENPWLRAKIVDGLTVANNTFKQIRWSDSLITKGISDAGWHFTTCGNFDIVKQKLTSFTHYSEPHMPATINGLKNKTWVENDDSIYLHDIDSSYPDDVVNNIDKWDKLGFIYKK